MLGPTNTAADVALLLEEGLRSNAIVLARTEAAAARPSAAQEKKHEVNLRFLSFEIRFVWAQPTKNRTNEETR
jgi:hypothetical protein